MNLKNKQVAIVGLGRSGFAAAELLRREGLRARVTELSADGPALGLAERLRVKGIAVEIGSHTEAFLRGSDLIVSSPGVEDRALPIKWAKRNKIKIIDEIELGYLFCKAPVIGVTGTNGKSTTACLVGHIFNRRGFKAAVCGNIGLPFSGEAGKLTQNGVVVLELSSFQLSRIDAFRPKAAVFLNATQNHLERHRNFREYFNAKMRIFENQTKTDWAVINCEDKKLMQSIKRIPAKKIFFSPDKDRFQRVIAGSGHSQERSNLFFASVDGNRLFVQIGKKKTDICDVDDLKIKGRHNLENALAAICAVWVFGVPPAVIGRRIATFKGLTHRCECAAVIKGVSFIDDSKSTTVDAAIKALNVCAGGVILIAGGRDKNSDFKPIYSQVKSRVKMLILIGEAKDKIEKALAGSTDIKQAQTLESAVKLAFNCAEKGDSVLLSPMCASFDMFEDFRHRGRVFKDAVRELR